MDLRYYQAEAADAVDAAVERSVHRMMAVLPTGTGKTVLFSEVIRRRRTIDPRPAVILAHREELLTQAAKTVRRLCPGITVGVEVGSDYAPRSSSVICASVPTVGKKDTDRLAWLEKIGASVIVVDEAHHSAAAGYMESIKRFGGFSGDTVVLGVTATPKRLDKKALHGHDLAAYEEIVYQYPIRRAIEDGFLCDIRGYIVQGDTNLDGVGKSRGDFNQVQLAKAVNQPSRTKRAIEHWFEAAGDRKTIVFCADVQHALDVRDAFEDAMVPAVCVHGKLTDFDRKRALREFESGEAQVLTNVQLATEGYDHPPIKCVLMLRPTMSWSLYSQMVGRGTRPFGGQDLIVIDVADNTERHDLASIPSILDLPPKLNIKGHTLLEAAKMLDSLGDDAEKIQDLLTQFTGKGQEQFEFDDLRTVMREVDLLKRTQAPDEILGVSKLAWVQVDGDYVVRVGSSPAGARTARVSRRSGQWTLVMTEGKTEIQNLALFSTGSDLTVTISGAEWQIEQTWPDTVFLAKRGTGWRARKPSGKQITLLKRFGYSDAIISQITAGDVDAMIQAKTGRRPVGAAR